MLRFILPPAMLIEPFLCREAPLLIRRLHDDDATPAATAAGFDFDTLIRAAAAMRARR